MTHYSLEVSSAPAAEPLSTSEAKAWMRVDLSNDDAIIDRNVKAARVRVEDETGLSLITQTRKLHLDRFPYSDDQVILIPRGPVQSITSITYYDEDGTQQTWSSSEYSIDKTSIPARLSLAYGYSWPTTRDIRKAVTITYVAGYGASGSSVPADILDAILLLASHWYEHRETDVVGATVTSVPRTWDYIINPWRRIVKDVFSY